MTEAVTEGWTLDSIGCDDDSMVVDLDNRRVTFVNDDPGYEIECTFTNRETVQATAPGTQTAPSAQPQASPVRYTG